MRRTLLGVSLLMTLAVAGCGSSSASSASSAANGQSAGTGQVGSATQVTSGGAPDPCTLLSRAEVEAAYGSPVAEGVPDIVNSCKWDGTPGSVSLHLLHIAGATCAAASANRTPLPGFSVPASWHFITAGSTGSVVACTNDWQVQVTVVGDIVGHTKSEAALQATAVQLMNLVLGRM
jgi:hypothetical protein